MNINEICLVGWKNVKLDYGDAPMPGEVDALYVDVDGRWMVWQVGQRIDKRYDSRRRIDQTRGECVVQVTIFKSICDVDER